MKTVEKQFVEAVRAVGGQAIKIVGMVYMKWESGDESHDTHLTYTRKVGIIKP